MHTLPLLCLLIACVGTTPPGPGQPVSRIQDIPTPKSFYRLPVPANSFGAWLRELPLKKNTTVYLYNGQPKANQRAQYAVVDISVGNRDLQQCADAVMRLRAEYLRKASRSREIVFQATDGTPMSYAEWSEGYRYILHRQHLEKKKLGTSKDDDKTFADYLTTVFQYAGTLSLSRDLHAVTSLSEVLPGDVLIHGGSPGHAEIVVDVSVNDKGERAFLLAQSYMPAQDIHVLVNPVAEAQRSPWYHQPSGPQLYTPEYVFAATEIKRF